MGSVTRYVCKACGTEFPVRDGGGFFFDMLHCDACGRAQGLGHRDLGEVHLRFVKGLDHPYAIARLEVDRRIQEEYPGEPLSGDEYHAAAEATAAPCSCGGRFTYDAPARCPNCRSSREMWKRDRSVPVAYID